MTDQAVSPLKISDDEFKCGICLDFLIKPVTLPCGHSFCLPCLNNPEVYQCSVCRYEFTEYGRQHEHKVNTILNKILPEIIPGYKERLNDYEREVEYKRLIANYGRSSRCALNTEIIYNIIGNSGINYLTLLTELESYNRLEIDLNLALLLKNRKIMVVGEYVIINSRDNLSQFARHHDEALNPETIIHLLQPVVLKHYLELHDVIYRKYQITNEITKRCQEVSLFNPHVYEFLKSIAPDISS